MDRTFADGKVPGQDISLLWENDSGNSPADSRVMRRRPSPAPKRKRQPPEKVRRKVPRLYVGEWIAACKKDPAEVAREAPVNEGYLSSLISGKPRKDPRASMLAAIAAVLDLKPGALFEPPPAEAFRAAYLAPRQPEQPIN